MKNKFIGFYDPTKEEIDEAWNNAIFAFDANTILNLYRYSDNTRKDFIMVLRNLKEKLFFPYQAAYEYHINRVNVIDKIEQDYDELYKLFSDTFDKNLKSPLNRFKRHPSILANKIEELYKDFLGRLEKELNKQRTKHPDFKTKDEVLENITKIFENSLGEDFSEEELIKIYNEGEQRYSKKIPPGYKDLLGKERQEKRYVYGDLIIWKELINFAKCKKQPLIFITDDCKEDWWRIQNGETIRPREELIKEFFDLTGIRILIYNSDRFLYYAKDKGYLPKIKDKTIEEIKKIRASDVIRRDSRVEFLASDILNAQMYAPNRIAAESSIDQYLASKSLIDPLYTKAYVPSHIAAELSIDQYLASKSLIDPLYAKTHDIHMDETYGKRHLAQGISEKTSDMLKAQDMSEIKSRTQNKLTIDPQDNLDLQNKKQSKETGSGNFKEPKDSNPKNNNE